MILPVTSLLAAALAILLVRLSLATIKARRASRVPVGVNADEVLLRATRAQGNFTEYVPTFLILMALSELNGVTPFWLGPLGAVFFAGRLMHAHSILYAETARADDETMGRFIWRARGMQITLFGTIALAATLLGALLLRALGVG